MNRTIGCAPMNLAGLSGGDAAGQKVLDDTSRLRAASVAGNQNGQNC